MFLSPAEAARVRERFGTPCYVYDQTGLEAAARRALDFPAPYYFDRPWIAEGVMNEPPLQRWIAEAQSADDVLRRMREAYERREIGRW